MPTYQVGTSVYESDKPLTDADLNQLAGSSQTAPKPQAANPVTNDLGQAASADFSSPTGQTAQPQTQSASQSPQDVLSGLLGQFGKGVYSNPIVHPALKALGDWAGANPEQAYAGVGEPQGLGQQVASGLGTAAPLLGVAGPMGMGIDATLGAARGVPILSRMATMLGDSTLAKSAITGLTYGAAEAKAAQMQGQPMDVGTNALNTAGQFLFWSALARGGASLGAKYISKDILKQPDLLKNMPLVGNATKNFFTPEGLGSIAGGALAGTIQSPDSKTGLAGAIVGGALSSMNPAEQFQFRQGMGKTLGFRGISTITDHMGKPFAEANDIFEQFGFNDVQKAGLQQIQQPNQAGGQDTMATPQIVAQTHLDALNKIKTQKQGLFDQALQTNENIAPKSMESFTSLLRQRVNQIQDPTSPVARVFNKMYDNLIGLRGEHLMSQILADKVSSGELNMPPGTDPSSLYRQFSPQMRESLIKQYQSKNNIPMLDKMTLNGLHQLKMSMQEMVSPEVWAGNRAMTPEERDANGIAKQIGNFIGKNNEAYADAGRQYSIFKNIQGKAYDLDATKLSQNMLAMDETKRNLRENDLRQISKYLTDNGKPEAASLNLLKKYYAYQVYNNPQTTGFVKSYPVREISTAAMAGLLHMTGIPGGALVGGLAGWNMSNPQAWLPALKGASMAKDAQLFRAIAPKLLSRQRKP